MAYVTQGQNPDGTIKFHQYEYRIADIRTNRILAELPFNGCTYTFKLSDIGTFSATLQINRETLKQSPQTATVPGRNALYVVRDGKVVWGGIIWGRDYSVASRSLTVSGETFESYFVRLFNMTTKYWTNTDQLDIARWLIQSRFLDEALLMTVSAKKSGVLRERTMFGYEFKTLGEELEQLSNLINGFEYEVQVYHDEGTKEIRRHLEFYYPAKGRGPSTSDLKFNYPGSLSDFSVQDDAKESANVVYTIGAGEGTEQLKSDPPATDTVQINDGWPKLELSRAYKSVYKPSTLKAHADKILKLKRSPISVYTVTVRPDADPPYGSYFVGDWANFTLEDPFLGKIDTWQRIVEISVNVAENGLEKISLVLDAGQEPIEDETDVII